MNPFLFFTDEQIIRNNSFSFTYAVGQELEDSIAYASDLKSLSLLNNIPSISVVITTTDLAERVNICKGLIISDTPQADFYKLHNFMVKENYIAPLNHPSIDGSALISPTARIGNNVVIGKNVTIDDYSIIESNTVIGDECEIGPFAVIGTTSMQRTLVEGKLFHLEHAGGVKIGDRCRVLTGAIIQKPYQAFYTTIGNDSVVSTRVIIGHGSIVGDRTLISGGSGIAGNCRIGDDVWIGGGAMISDGIEVGNGAKVMLGSIVIKDVKLQEIVSGNFAINHRKNIRHQINLKN